MDRSAPRVTVAFTFSLRGKLATPKDKIVSEIRATARLHRWRVLNEELVCYKKMMFVMFEAAAI